MCCVIRTFLGGSRHYMMKNNVSNIFLFFNIEYFFKGSGYFAIWRQNSPIGYFAASAKIALSIILTQTLTPTLILTLALTQT